MVKKDADLSRPGSDSIATARNPHLIIEDVGNGHNCRCLNCGDSHFIAFPCGFDAYLKAAKGFERRHKACKPPGPQAPTR